MMCQREGFAMNVSSFHFDVKLTDIADYDYVDLLEVRSTRLERAEGTQKEREARGGGCC